MQASIKRKKIKIQKPCQQAIKPEILLKYQSIYRQATWWPQRNLRTAYRRNNFIIDTEKLLLKIKRSVILMSVHF
jgi:hypothetical protein